MMPMPYLPASVMPEGEICDATTKRHLFLQGQDLERRHR